MKSSRWSKKIAILLLFTLCMTSLSFEAQAGRKDLTHGIWSKHGKNVTVTTSAGTRTYYAYDQLRCKGEDRRYYPSHGCVTVGVSIAASGFGVVAKPWSIHKGKATLACSESLALSQLQQKRKNTAISLRLASQILTNIGIPNKVVTAFSNTDAEAQIRKHLQEGKPVIVKVNSAKYKGVKFTTRHHTLVLIGMADDYVVFINPIKGKVNGSRVGKKRSKINLTLNELVTHFMYSSADTMSAYTSKASNGGGYILVG